MSSRESVNSALVGFKATHGQPALRELLENVAGVTAISLVPEDKFGALFQAIQAAPKPAPAEDMTLDSIRERAFAKWNREWKKRPER